MIKEPAVPLVKMLITQKDDGFTDKASDVLAEMLSVNRTNPDGADGGHLSIGRDVE